MKAVRFQSGRQDKSRARNSAVIYQLQTLTPRATSCTSSCKAYAKDGTRAYAAKKPNTLNKNSRGNQKTCSHHDKARHGHVKETQAEQSRIGSPQTAQCGSSTCPC